MTCSTGWECYAVCEELTKTGKYRVRALYRTPGTQAAERLETLLAKTEAEHPGLLTIQSGMDMTSAEKLTEGFADCDGVVLYCTANTAKAGKITNHGNDPVGGRIAFMNQVSAALAALKANPSVKHVITLVFPTDKVTGIADDVPEIPWWIDQRLRFSNFLRGQGINVTCLHRPAYYYGLHRVDYTRTVQQRGKSAMSKNMIKENNMPGINDADFMVNWVDVRDVGKWCGTVFEYPEVFSNVDFSIASCAMTGNESVEIAERHQQARDEVQVQAVPAAGHEDDLPVRRGGHISAALFAVVQRQGQRLRLRQQRRPRRPRQDPPALDVREEARGLGDYGDQAREAIMIQALEEKVASTAEVGDAQRHFARAM